jgi:dynein heavy chain
LCAAAINGVFGRLMAGHFSAAAFSAPLGAAAQRLVPATMALWGRVQAKLLPTPAKFHYQFTLRDVSRVFQGVMLAHPDAFAGAGAEGAAGEEACLVALWEHECRRVFADKLVSPEDKGWVEAALEELCREASLQSLNVSNFEC